MGFVQLPLEDGGDSHRFMIEEIGDAGGAASFQQLGTYAGPLVKVRRASDNQEQDFASVGDGIDSAALIAFLDGTTGFISVWYDQTESGYNLVQASAGSQPQILQDEHGYWYANCTQKFLASATYIGAQTNSTLHVLWQCLSNGALPVTNAQGGINLGSGNNIIVPWWTTVQSPTFKDAGASSFNWCDNKPRQHVFKFLNGVCTPFEFASNSRTPITTANPTYSELSVGASLVEGNVRVYEIATFKKDADQTTLFDITKNNYPAIFEEDTLWLSIGDSNTATGFSNLGANWTNVQIQTQPITTPYYSRAIGGLTLQAVLNNPQDVTFYLENISCNDANVIIFLGTNDIVVNGTSGADTYQLLCDLADLVRAAGATNISAITMLPRTAGAPFATERDIFNGLLLANAESKFDTIINTTAVPALQNQNDTTYFADTTHLNNTGQAVLAGIVVAAF